MKTERYDVIWLLGQGIGNVLEALYSVELAIKRGVKCGVFFHNVSSSFSNYLEECYPHVILKDSNVHAKHLIHSWLYEDKILFEYDNYHYVNPSQQSVQYCSETEAYLNIIKSIFGGDNVDQLESLKESKPAINLENLSEKIVVYTGCTAHSPVKRWPHYQSLIEEIGWDNCIIIGGEDDRDFSVSYIYPKIITTLFHKKITNRIRFWKLCKKLRILKPYSHLDFMKQPSEQVFLNKFSWSEIVYIFRRIKYFVGNDGGLSHLASVCGASGTVIFGPSSVEKNKPISKKFNSISKSFSCQPCFYSPQGIHMGRNYINCPYQIRCLQSISVSEVLKEIPK
jgi:ADP-heptose:LPS heptosyltransferase